MSSQLLFQIAPWSFWGILALIAFAGLSIAGWHSLRFVADRRRRWLLLALRSAAYLCLLLLVLGPEQRSQRVLEVSLPRTLTQAGFKDPPEQVVAAQLPPAEAVTGYRPAPDDRPRLKSVSPPQVALYKNRDEVTVEIEAFLAAEGNVTLSLYDLSSAQGRRELKSQTITLPAGRNSSTVKIPFIPEHLGRMVVGVRLDCARENPCPTQLESREFQVMRPQIRILHLGGHPSWDLRFLREYLKSRPRFELISFYVLANQDNFQPLPPDELALIPFPTDELFLSELPGFDLLVFQDFPLGSYFMLKDEHLMKIRDFVKNGGGVMFIGGPASFGAGGLNQTPIKDLLTNETLEGAGARTHTQGSGISATAGGLRHPALRLAAERLRQPLTLDLGFINLLGPRKQGVTLLLEDGNGVPLATAGAFGRGRVLTIATDGLWKLAFAPPGREQQSRVYEDFFDGAIAWLSNAPGFEELTISYDQAPIEARDFKPRLCLSGPNTGIMVRYVFTSIAAGQPFSGEAQLRPGSDSCATLSLPAMPCGAWNIRATPDNSEVAAEFRIAVGRQPEGETSRLSRLLSSLLPPPFPPPKGPQEKHVSLVDGTPSIAVEARTPLVGKVPLLVLLLSLLTTEWLLRRKAGLP